MRLVTILGAGGMGKTRLALAAAEAQLETIRFPNGVFFVPLAPIHSKDRIVQTIAGAMKLPLMVQEDPQTQLLRFDVLLLARDGDSLTVQSLP